ncbi:MAG: site-specific integrase [Planctomycetes bacterium]|nr:site-specific integrase [Planctomycetota bacterium]
MRGKKAARRARGSPSPAAPTPGRRPSPTTAPAPAASPARTNSRRGPFAAKAPTTEADEPRLAPGARAEVADFLDALRVEAGLARKTVEAYRLDLGQCARWLAEHGVRRWDEVDADRVVDWLAHRRAAGMAEATVARNLVSLRMLLRFLVQEGRLAKDPTHLIRSPHLRRALPGVIAPDEVDALLAAPNDRAWPAWKRERDQALLEVLYATGARVSEAVALRTDALEPKLRVLRLTGKGNKTRLVPLGERARVALERWLANGRRRFLADAHRPEVFLTKSGRPLSRVDAWRVVRRRARGGDPRQALTALAAALVRVAPRRGRRGPARRAGDARARLDPHDRGLHPRRLGPRGEPAPALPPARLTGPRLGGPRLTGPRASVAVEGGARHAAVRAGRVSPRLGPNPPLPTLRTSVRVADGAGRRSTRWTATARESGPASARRLDRTGGHKPLPSSVLQLTLATDTGPSHRHYRPGTRLRHAR